MTGLVTLVSSPDATAYDLGAGHPLRAVRGTLTVSLAEQLGVLDRPVWKRSEAPSATPEQLAHAHDEVYLAIVSAADRASPGALRLAGLGTDDTPVFPGMHAAASAVVGATVEACRSVWAGDTDHAVNLFGGWHHAMRSHASGFCVYNDASVGIAELLRAGCSRVAYVDIDAHHGDGVEAMFASDPRVLTISIHQDGRTIFPGTGFATDIGAPGAEGSAVNVPLPPHTDDAGWLRALTATVPVLLRAFAPEVLVTQCGCDAHWRDPLTDLRASVEGFTIAYGLLHALAHEVCGGRWVVLGGGGYDIGSAVPRSWTQLLAVTSDGELDARCELPPEWQAESRSVSGEPAPQALGDRPDAVSWRPWDAGEGDPDSPLDRAIAATRRAVLPLHGLDPHLDR